MPEAFLEIEPEERLIIYETFARDHGYSRETVEKDVWVCWALDALFTMPNALSMAFKGGTSLSKVFNVISRFSEDIDVTIDYTDLDGTVDPFDGTRSRNKVKEHGEHLRGLVINYVEDVVAPYFRDRLATEYGLRPTDVAVGDDGETLLMSYPRVFDYSSGYVAPSIKIEFGGRNAIVPNAAHRVAPYLRSVYPDLDFPVADPVVLSAERTFWEKATFMHDYCGRPPTTMSADRLSRHWYDLDQMSQSAIGTRALDDRVLLADVVKIKQAFYSRSTSEYDKCLSGRMRLVPDDDSVRLLATDYRVMRDARMIVGGPSQFGEIVNRLRDLESEVNQAS
ncbi:MAG: nucleotidyl transferase AbiEii/AbiGii toxin family protein [Acidimicrobiales bacterium]